MRAKPFLCCDLLRDDVPQKRGSLRVHLAATWIPASGPPVGRDAMTVRVWRLDVFILKIAVPVNLHLPTVCTSGRIDDRQHIEATIETSTAYAAVSERGGQWLQALSAKLAGKPLGSEHPKSLTARVWWYGKARYSLRVWQ